MTRWNEGGENCRVSKQERDQGVKCVEERVKIAGEG